MLRVGPLDVCSERRKSDISGVANVADAIKAIVYFKQLEANSFATHML